MQLKTMVIADPDHTAAELVQRQCERLAEKRLIAHSASEALELVGQTQPELAILSWEIKGGSAPKLIPELTKRVEGLLVIVTYRELAVSKLKQLTALGIEDIVTHPVDPLEIFRAASRRFKVPFRRHDRFAATIDVRRADGVVIGRTIDISEGGMYLEAFHPLSPGESVLVDIAIVPDEKPLRTRCEIRHVDGRPPKPVRVNVQFSALRGPQSNRLLDFLETLKKAKGNADRK